MHYRLKQTIKIVAAVAAILPFSAAAGFAADTPNPAESRSLIVGSADSQWTNNGDRSIVLSKGSVVIIAGNESLKVETNVGAVEVSPNLEAVVQQNDATTVTAIACRRVVNEESSDCALTVSTNDDSTYKVYPGKQLKLIAGESVQVSDVVMLKQQPELAVTIRKAANDLTSAAFSLLSDASAGNTQTIDACARTLMSGSAEGPAKLYVTDGANIVALQPGSMPEMVAVKPRADVQPLPAASNSNADDHEIGKMEAFTGSSGQSAMLPQR